MTYLQLYQMGWDAYMMGEFLCPFDLHSSNGQAWDQGWRDARTIDQHEMVEF